MTRGKSVCNSTILGWLIAVLALISTPSFAATIWADWTSATLGLEGGGSATGNGGAITYNGELDGVVVNGSANFWQPLSTYVGGTITTSPSTAGDALYLDGSYTGVNTITWASPVINPVMAFNSLGNENYPAWFIFIDATPTFQVGGRSGAGAGGHAIEVRANNMVWGDNTNGVVEFTGTFSSISWTNGFENSGVYAFAVGANGPRATGAPEPASLALLGLGLAGLGFSRRKKV
jgi:hypothetical protein